MENHSNGHCVHWSWPGLDPEIHSQSFDVHASEYRRYGPIVVLLTTAATEHGSLFHMKYSSSERKLGAFLWEGKYRPFTVTIMQAPWSMIWQSIILSSVIYCFIMEFLILHYSEVIPRSVFISLILCSILYAFDICIYILHSYWPLVRANMRVYRRSGFVILLDLITLLPTTDNVCDGSNMQLKIYDVISRWLDIARVYRLFEYFVITNKAMHKNRLLLYTLQHAVMTALILHAGTCVWYWAHLSTDDVHHSWYKKNAYPHTIGAEMIEFDNYLNCLYYTSCRIYNVLFGDTYPVSYLHKWITVTLMLVGYIFVRYAFIGVIAWKMVVKDTRRLTFIDRYHHMLSYLRFRNAPEWLIKEASQYKMQLWHKKDGVLASDHLRKLPLPLQMELIFDINVAHFHQTLLFREAGEAFLRQISLLMQHEIFLEGQSIWSQGIVKRGMICVKRGVIEMLSDEDDESPVIAFRKGTVLGELSLFYSIPAKVTIKAATYVEIQVLYRTDFMRAMAERPHKLNEIREKIDERLKKSIKRQREINEYEKGDSRLIRTRYRPMKVLKDHLGSVEDEDTMICDDSHLYYRDENNERKAKFTNEYLELYKETARVTTVLAPSICLRSTFPWILEPDTTFTQMFDVAHFLLIFIMSFMIPYNAVFNINDGVWDDIGYIVMKAGLVFQIYIQLTTAIVDKNKNLNTVQEIAEEKMSHLGFYLDILSIFPFFILTDTLDPDKLTVAGQIAYLAPVLQFWHIWDYINKWRKSFYSYEKLTCLMKYGISLTVLGYWAGCFLYLYSCPRKLCRKGSWMAALIYWETKVIVTSEAKHENQLAVSINFGSSILCGTGQEDVSPGSKDIPVVISLMIFGMYIIGFYIANTCSIYTLSSKRKQEFRESMRELFYFLSFNNVGDKIKARVAKFFSVQWYYNHGVSTAEIFENMPTKIRQEVIFVELVETLLCCPFFKDCSRDFLQTIAANTRTIVLPDNEVVQHAADITRDMYILQKGHCNLLSTNTKSVISKGPGSQFGVVEMFFALPKVYTVVTTTNCIILHLEYSALMQCLSIFPDVHDNVTAVCEDKEVIQKTLLFEDPRPLTGRIETKINRIAQEIKESFVALTGREVRKNYIQTYEKLGVMRYIKFIIIPGCITPHGIFLKIWCWLRFFVASFYILILPYNLAVRTHRFNISHETDYYDIILYIDILVMSYVAYYDDRSVLITHPLFTISHYLRHAFLLDFITVFPFEFWIGLVNEQVNKDILRLNRILQVFRITATIHYLESDIMKVNQVVVLLKFLPLAVTLVNMITAFMFWSHCETFVVTNVTHIMVNCTRALVTNDVTVQTSYAVTEYLYTFYSAFEIFFGCGSTSVSISNTTGFWIVTALLIFGTLYFGFMFGYVASTRSATSTALLNHTETTKDLADFLYQTNVDPILTEKTLKYFEYIWKRTNGSNPQKNCRLLNSALMEDTLVFMYEKTLREVPLFGNVDRSFIRVITQHLTEMYFLKGETVIQCRDVQPYIYIIYRGKVDVLSSYNEMVTCMGPGGMFGNFTGKPISCSEVSIYASRSLDLLVIPSQTFFNLIKYYPKIQEPLNKAFERSKDYILPITVDMEDDEESMSSDMDEGSEDDDLRSKDDETASYNSEADSKSNSYIVPALGGSLSTRGSHSNISYARSSSSRLTYQGYGIGRLYRSGSSVNQIFGYVTCFIATVNYILISYDLITCNQCLAVTWVHFIFDIFFYIKIYISLHQSYNNKRGDIITESERCRKHYLKQKWLFWSDLIVNIPIEPFALLFSSPIPISQYLRAKKIFRVKYLIEFYNKTASQLTNNITTLQTAMTFLVTALLLHTFTCLWLLILMLTNPIRVIRILKVHLLDDQMLKHYWDFTTSFYVITSEVTETGLDEYAISDSAALLMLAVSVICGKMMSAIVVATAMQVAYSTQYALIVYEKCTKELIDVLKNQGLSRYQMNKLWTYVQQLWVSERGRQLPVLLAKTPYVRRCDLMSAMFGHHLRNCFIFSETGEPFLRQLAVVLEFTIYFPGNYIVVAGDSEPRIFWVVVGVVSVVSVRSDLTETTHELLRAGDVFGIMQGLNRGLAHCFSYRAETKVSIVALSLDSWVHILPFFPEAQKSITKRTQILFTDIAKIR